MWRITVPTIATGCDRLIKLVWSTRARTEYNPVVAVVSVGKNWDWRKMERFDYLKVTADREMMTLLLLLITSYLHSNLFSAFSSSQSLFGLPHCFWRWEVLISKVVVVRCSSACARVRKVVVVGLYYSRLVVLRAPSFRITPFVVVVSGEAQFCNSSC